MHMYVLCIILYSEYIPSVVYIYIYNIYVCTMYYTLYSGYMPSVVYIYEYISPIYGCLL